MFAKSAGSVKFTLPAGNEIEIPIVHGILKHPTGESLRELLRSPGALRKYTFEALRKAPWPILRQFPRSWLKARMKEAHITRDRRRALDFLLSCRNEKK